jgi:hypothetical protein
MSEEITKPLIVSMVGPLANKIKSSLKYAKKNRKLGENLAPAMDLLLEQLLPFNLAKDVDNYYKVNRLHNLVFLLAMKSQQVFTSRVIHSAID